MLHQRYKDIAFWGIAKATVPNYFLRRYVTSARSAKSPCHLHLGCGTKYLPGFLNIDGNLFNKIDVWLDVRNGLPFRSDSVESIYSTHMFEHFYPDELNRILQECARVLKLGAVFVSLFRAWKARLSPIPERSEWFDDSFPRHFDSLGGRFSNFVFCDGQHRTAFDFSYLNEVLWKRDFAKWRSPPKGRAVCMVATFRLMSPETRRISRIPCM